ncbi:MAG: tetratricopeptide repeat protein [Acidobacteriaceae bacterium]|nr:tetratricopeptide repeat protein [Acidobacteriaceae bacterium]
MLIRRIGFANVLFSLCCASLSPAQDLSKAEELFNRTKYEASLAIIDKNTQGAASNFLLGRDYLMIGEFKKASDHLEEAVAANPGSSEYHDWLGRAYGRRAETSNPIMAPSYAARARRAFERAVELDPQNRDALDDLFDYYLEAPGFLGGGFDKAAVVAEKLSAIDPGEAYYDQFKLDQKRKEFGTAEQHLRQAVASAPHSVGHLLALAKFLATQGRLSESDALFAKAQQTAPNNPTVWFAQADVLVKQRRNLAEAKALLTKYVNAPITADDPPREEALRLLKQAGGA